MKLVWTVVAWNEYLDWQELDKKTLRRVNQLLKDALRHPCEGVGKPEPLKHGMTNVWSRRIDSKHRLVYYVEDDAITVMQCFGHYDD